MRLAHSHVFGDSVRHAFFELLLPKFCVARSHTGPRVKTKNPLGCKFIAFEFKLNWWVGVNEFYLSQPTSTFLEKDFGTIFVQSVGVVEHAWFAVSVSFRNKKFLLEVVGILSLLNYSWTFGLQIVSLGTYGMHCEIKCPSQLEF